MNENLLSVREMREADVELIVQYWLNADSAFLQGMGVDLDKVPGREQLTDMLSAQLSQSYEEKQSYCIIWLVDGRAVGHSNVNKIVFDEEAYMHLHLWDAAVRGKGFGTILVKMTLPFFFKNLKLKKLYCEPYALNPAPNNTLAKIGFDFVQEYVTVPGWINFEQPVKRWALSREQFLALA